jgi:hypothetical protein
VVNEEALPHKPITLAGRLLIGDHDVPIEGSLQLNFYVDEIPSIGVEAAAAVGLRMLSGNWDFPIAEVHADAGESTVTYDMIEATCPGLDVEAAEGITRLFDSFDRAREAHDDPRAHALWQRKNRNTGPKPRRRRPPKTLAR